MNAELLKQINAALTAYNSMMDDVVAITEARLYSEQFPSCTALLQRHEQRVTVWLFYMPHQELEDDLWQIVNDPDEPLKGEMIFDLLRMRADARIEQTF
jgi:hypothetical protein